MPIVTLIVAMASFQFGAAIAKGLFPVVGAPGATALRLGLGSFMLLALWRPWRVRPSRREARTLITYGLALGCMNLCFYISLSRIPLGVAVALEFTGPLAVAIATSRRPVDFLWVALAALGLAALLPLGVEPQPLDPSGIGFALAAGFFWALYIVFGQQAGDAHGGQTTALGMVIAAVLVVPIGIWDARSALLSSVLLPAAWALAVLSCALPYSLEMYALTRIPARTYGVLMSSAPALGALSGLVFLGERLSVLHWGAIACIMLASAGSAASGRRTPSSG